MSVLLGLLFLLKISIQYGYIVVDTKIMLTLKLE